MFTIKITYLGIYFVSIPFSSEVCTTMLQFCKHGKRYLRIRITVVVIFLWNKIQKIINFKFKLMVAIHIRLCLDMT